MPILPTGIYVKDLARAIKTRFECVTSDMFVAHPITAVPYPGKKWLLPYEPVRVWVLPLGQLPVVSSSHLPYLNCNGESNHGDKGYAAKTTDLDSPTVCPVACAKHRQPNPETPEKSDGDDSDSDNNTSSTKPDTMPFHAVRAGRKPGIFLSKAEVLPQILDFPGAEYKTFASFAEASAYLTGSLEAVEERDLMSAGSRAKHPPSKSTTPDFCAAASTTAQVGIINAVFHCLTDPDTRIGYCVATLYPSCNKDAGITHTYTMEGMQSAAKAELSAVILVVRACTAVHGYIPGRTLVRTYCASTYATNALNDYAVNKMSWTGANGSIMVVLSELLKTVKARAFWTAQTDAALADTIRQTIQLRLRGVGRKGSESSSSSSAR